MARETLSDMQVEMEIERLKESEHVKLAQKEIRLRYKQRKWLYQLRWLEKRGKELEALGITLDDMEAQLREIDAEGAEGEA